MRENKRELLKKAFGGIEVNRVPCGFWHHFILGKDQFIGLEQREVLDRAIKGHIDYYNKVNTDMMKLMNEGFFGYPPIMNNKFDSREDLLKVQSIGENHEWIVKQVEHVRKLTDIFADDVMTFYNVFAPLQAIRIRFDFLDMDFSRFVMLAEKYPEEFKMAGMEIQKDFKILVKKLLNETKLDGIYYCVQNIQSDMYDKKMYDEYIKPTEIGLLELANQISDYNILHICGYAHHKNDLSFYKEYKAKVYNWAVHTEGVSIKEGKKIFGGASILGGFDNNPKTLIDSGSKEELEKYVKDLIDENGYKGYIIGADCSIPNDIDDQKVRHISDATYKYSKEE